MGSIQLKLSIDSICGIMLNATDIQDSLSRFIKKLDSYCVTQWKQIGQICKEKIIYHFKMHDISATISVVADIC